MKLRKILALVLAVVMMMAMSSIAMAATSTATLPVDDSDNSTVDAAAVVSDLSTDDYNGVTFKVYFNENKTDAGVDRPAATFTYTVAAATADDGVDADKGIAAGDINWVTSATRSLSTDTWATVTKSDASNSYNSDELTISFSGIPTGKAGIFRYTVTQSEITGASATLGIKNENDTQAAVKQYLDVYINNSGKVIGVVMFKDKTDGIKSATATGTVVTYSGKTDGFRNALGNNDDDPTTDPTVPDPDPDVPSKPTSDPDSIGYMVEIDKLLSGAMASTDQDFEFNIQLTAPEGTATALNGYEVHVNHAATRSTDIAVMAFNASGVATGTIYLKGKEAATLTGLPHGVKVEIKEATPATDGYKISSNVTTMDASANLGNFATPNDNANPSSESAFKTTGKVQENYDGKIQYKNHRDAISPTGVVLRYAPYVAMLAAGVALFIILGVKRRKSNEEA